jgi:hypothetical protein
MPVLDQGEAKELVMRRHPEWMEHHVTWEFLMDSYESGRRYRVADYAEFGQASQRNLMRHTRETPLQTSPPTSAVAVGGRPTTGVGDLEVAARSTYDLRLARTPSPGLVQDAVTNYVNRIYDKEVIRPDTNPQPVRDWWDDVDGERTHIDDWMQDTVAPILIVIGHIDILCDHPPLPEAGRPAPGQLLTMADFNRYGLGEVRASVILTQNVLWWLRGTEGQYAEALVREYHDDLEGCPLTLLRHWTGTGSVLYDINGVAVDALGNPLSRSGNPAGTEPFPHPYGRPPIVRCFDRKKIRSTFTGQSRMEVPAELMRDYYNRDSELILSDVMQSGPLLSGPSDALGVDAAITVGPGWTLPKINGETWEYVAPDKAGDESIRANLSRRRDEIDSATGQTKPAGVAGTSGQTVAQSGVSKELDQEGGEKRLSKIAAALARVEVRAAELCLLVYHDGSPPPAELDAIEVIYPRAFNLYSGVERMGLIGKFQDIAATAGQLPTAEGEMLKMAAREALKGRDDSTFDDVDEEIDRYMAEKRRRYEERMEAGGPPPTPQEAAFLSPGRQAAPPRPSEAAGPAYGSGLVPQAVG